jgi:hypothetical protein
LDFSILGPFPTWKVGDGFDFRMGKDMIMGYNNNIFLP